MDAQNCETGALFLDELPEFQRPTLEALRQQGKKKKKGTVGVLTPCLLWGDRNAFI